MYYYSKELEERLQAYKESLSEEEVLAIVEATHGLEAYQEAEEDPEDQEKIPVLCKEDISPEIAPIYNEEMNSDT